jgi:hypothetical protein
MTREAILLAAAIALAAMPARGQQPVCAPIERLTEFLSREHNEKPVAVGEMPGGQVVVFAAPSGSWTLVIVGPDGRACVASDGTRWRALGRSA